MDINALWTGHVDSSDLNLVHHVWMTYIYIFVSCVVLYLMGASLADILAQGYK
jgi:hypothetical protein